jgi:hypothetical protein
MRLSTLDKCILCKPSAFVTCRHGPGGGCCDANRHPKHGSSVHSDWQRVVIVCTSLCLGRAPIVFFVWHQLQCNSLKDNEYCPLIKKILVATATPCRCFVQVAVHLCKDARGGAERSGELRLLELPRSDSGRSQQQARRLHWPGQRDILPAARSGVRPLCDLAHRALCVVSRVLFPLSSRTGACSHKKRAPFHMLSCVPVPRCRDAAPAFDTSLGACVEPPASLVQYSFHLTLATPFC